MGLFSWILGGCSFSARPPQASERRQAVNALNSDDLVAQAASCGTQGDLKRAVAIADDALRIDPRQATGYVVRATALRKLGSYQQAIQDCSKAIEIDPSFSEAYCQRAFAYQQSQLDDRIERAFADAAKAIELKRTNSLAFIIRGNARLERNEYQHAIADFTCAIELNPTSYSAYGNRARAYCASGDLMKARNDIDKALSLNPPKTDASSLQVIRDTLIKRR
jgi:tetratricopeptide (TPR) repeat protein